jgi:solute carrier family 25 phosphate transporter 23/24/25/41|uniref:Solute carrier family 25, member 54 n=1 Tax=Mus musculus TaxID=10090 RepID=E0CY52_MOUSE
MLRRLQDFLLPSEACQNDYNRLAYEVLFEDLDHNGDGVVDITELRDGLKHWNSSFSEDTEKVSH